MNQDFDNQRIRQLEDEIMHLQELTSKIRCKYEDLLRAAYDYCTNLDKKDLDNLRSKVGIYDN